MYTIYRCSHYSLAGGKGYVNMIHDLAGQWNSWILVAYGATSVQLNVRTVITPCLYVAIVERHLMEDARDARRCGYGGAVVEVSHQDGTVRGRSCI